jgi:AcrR family transcriptional regulator
MAKNVQIRTLVRPPDPIKVSPLRKTRAEIGEERRARMRQRLLEAGARVIADRGASRATIDDFIREADVARGTFYNHFKTQEDLLEALWGEIGHDPFADMQKTCARIADPVERLASVTRRVLREGAANPTLGWLIIAMSADEKTLNSDLLSYPGPDLRAGLADGRFRYDDFASACDLVVGTVRSGLRALLSSRRSHYYPEALCKLILLALGCSLPDAHRISMLPLAEI